MQEYLKSNYDFFYIRKDESKLSVVHFICLKKDKDLIKGNIVVMLPFNYGWKEENAFEIKNKEIYDSLDKAKTDETIAKKVIDYIEENVNWDDIYAKHDNKKEKGKNISKEER